MFTFFLFKNHFSIEKISIISKLSKKENLLLETSMIIAGLKKYRDIPFNTSPVWFFSYVNSEQQKIYRFYDLMVLSSCQINKHYQRLKLIYKHIIDKDKIKIR